MRRRRWFEFHDQRWFPGFLRDLVTDALEAMWNTNQTYRPVAPLLREAVRSSGAHRIVDLCSGGGGPWLGLYDEVADGRRLEVWFTDLYPSARVTAGGRFIAHAEPVDACDVPRELCGFRTMFSSIHHFDPEAARALLADAFARREGIAVFDAAQRSPRTMLALTAVPLLALKNGAAIQPFSWNRILWTCLLPVVPAVLWVDGLLSCLRSYSLDDLRELTEGLSDPAYEWRIGEQHGGVVPVTYLIGMPVGFGPS